MNYIAGPNQLLTSQSTPGVFSTNNPKAIIFTNNIRNNKDSTLNNNRNNIHSTITNPFRNNNISTVTTTNIVRNNGKSTTTNPDRNNNTTNDVINTNINRNNQFTGLNALNTNTVTSSPNLESISNTFTNIINPLFPRPNLNPKINRLFPNRQLTNTINQQQTTGISSSSNNSQAISNFNSGTANTWHDLILRSQSQQKQHNSTFSQEKHFVKSFPQFPSKILSKALLSTSTTSISPSNSNKLGNLVNVSPTTTSNNSGKGRQLLPQIARPILNSAAVLRRPFTVITRPRSRVVQTPASEEYIKSFPEVAAPEGFPEGVKDPEEETIRSNIIELQRIN